MIRVVLDTNVIIAALRSNRGASYQIVQLIGTGLFIPCISAPLLLEYESAILRQPEGCVPPRDAVMRVLDFVYTNSHRPRIYYRWRPTVKDPNDEIVAEVAVASGARYIITYNKRDFVGIERFGIEAIASNRFLRKLRPGNESD